MKYPTPKDRFNIEDFNGNFRELDKRVTDQSDYNNLKNKPFGESIVEIMPETEVVGVEEDGSYNVAIDPSLFVGVGETLIVIFDGVEYVCNVDNSMGFAAFGNMSLVSPDGEDTGEPFIIVPMYEVMTIRDGDNHTISICANGVKKLDKKYISEKTFYYDITNPIYMYGDMALTNKITEEELSKVMSGEHVDSVIGLMRGIVVVIHKPLYCGIDFTTSEVVIHVWNGDGCTVLHTAEYTP